MKKKQKVNKKKRKKNHNLTVLDIITFFLISLQFNHVLLTTLIYSLNVTIIIT